MKCLNFIKLLLLNWFVFGSLFSVVYAGSFENCFAPGINLDSKTNLPILKQTIKSPLKTKEYILFNSICSISGTDKRLKNKDLILLDVRSKSENEKFRINNSINMPLSLIKTKSFWKSEMIVLINNGFTIKPLIVECGQLRKKGFKQIFVYKPGIASWSNNYGTLIGNYSKKDLSSISAKELFMERDEFNWIVIDATDKDRIKKINRLQKYFPDIIKYSKREKYKKSSTKSDSIRYVFVDNVGERFDLFNSINLADTHFLQGGVESFTALIDMQYKITTKQEFTLQKPRSCK